MAILLRITSYNFWFPVTPHLKILNVFYRWLVDRSYISENCYTETIFRYTPGRSILFLYSHHQNLRCLQRSPFCFKFPNYVFTPRMRSFLFPLLSGSMKRIIDNVLCLLTKHWIFINNCHIFQAKLSNTKCTEYVTDCSISVILLVWSIVYVVTINYGASYHEHPQNNCLLICKKNIR